MRLSVIIPAHNAASTLANVLSALQNGTHPPYEIIVADDASTDESTHIAASHGARVMRFENGPHGPAWIRNRVAEVATGEILVFLDADVRVHGDTLERIAHAFKNSPEVVALFGSYDDAPPARGVISRYYNLRHHWTHQHAARDAWTFWSGCGAVKREVFAQFGGFDESFARPSVEDIEFGRRLRRAGHQIRLCPDVQATHLKSWTLSSWLRTDIVSRAIPWTRMLLREDEKVPTDLNLSWQSRLSALALWLFVALLIAGFWHPLLWLGAGATLLIVGACNVALFRFFARCGGLFFASGAALCHGLYFLYSSAIFAVLTIISRFTKRSTTGCGRRSLALFCLMAATAFNGLAWSVMVPPLHTLDASQHFLYAHEIARQDTLSIQPDDEVPRDLWLLSAWLPRAIIAARDLDLSAPLDAQNRARAALNRELRIIEASGAQRVKDAGRLIGPKNHNFVRFHPPGYYAVLSRVLLIWPHSSVQWRLLTARWFSVALSVLAVALCVAIGHQIWPQRPSWALLLGALVAFQPVNAFTLASISNDAALIPLFSAFLLVGLLVLQRGMTAARGALLAAITAAGLLVKMSFASVIPLLLFLIVWRYRRERCVYSRRSKHPKWSGATLGWALALVVPILLAGPWYVTTLGGGSTQLLRTSFVVEMDVQPAAETASVGNLDWEGQQKQRWEQNPFAREIVTCVRVLVSYWGGFGGIRVPAAFWITLLAITAFAAVQTSRFLLQPNLRIGARRPRVDALSLTPRQRRGAWWLGAGTLALVTFYAFVDWRTRVSTGGPFGLRGSYYLPAIAGQMAWLMLGFATLFTPINQARKLWILGGAMALLNAYCLMEVVGRDIYGNGSWLALWTRASTLQPVALSIIIGACIGAWFTMAVFLWLLWNSFEADCQTLVEASARPLTKRALT